MLVEKWSDIVPQGYLDVTLVSVEHNTKSFKDRRRRVHIMTFNCRYLGVDFRRTVELQNRNVNTWCPKFNGVSDYNRIWLVKKEDFEKWCQEPKFGW